MAYNAVPTAATGDLWTAAQHNTYIKDNLAYLYDRTHTVKFFIPAIIDQGGTYKRTGSGVELPNAADTIVNSGFMVPPNYVSGLVVTPVITGPLGASSNAVNLTADVAFGKTAESRTNTSQTSGGVNVTTPASSFILLATTLALTLTSPEVGDFVNVALTRNGSAGGDTFTNSVYAYGWQVEYVAYQ